MEVEKQIKNYIDSRQGNEQTTNRQQYISVMRAKVLNLNELNINKHKVKPKVKCY